MSEHEHNHYPIFLPDEEEKERIVIPEENGDENLFDVLFYFDVPETDKSYVVVVPAEQDLEEDEEQEVFAFRYEGNDDDFKLFPIETDEEWDIVEEMINTFSDESDE
ncbi:DUF1292 domain-containing protein [Sporolactobacillus terrae]|uniref:UPF0473 protein C0674_09695 n=1 Tax=Sporolactobacillus terrae TaxID=269673 RepID=A0ABX5Q880_9BACL|nr:DUF1292 domain-containing protein [Sporolactobacillus terrae]QAA22873.1 DUF1292 domain-containing protein [Sporolactobacillus terrae]QAA25847.1 DUF1292 domain-containing protein [Sporolactobacillus terrae]UAK17721.1 DUF1292 domain-containing protein [Sporolactobacillus terrae]